MGRSPNANQGISHNVLKPSEGHRNCDDWAILKISLSPKKSLEVESTNKKKGCWGILGDFQQLAPLKTTLKSNAHTPPDKCQLESNSYWSHTGWSGRGWFSLGWPSTDIRHGNWQGLAAQRVLREGKCSPSNKNKILHPIEHERFSESLKILRQDFWKPSKNLENKPHAAAN